MFIQLASVHYTYIDVLINRPKLHNENDLKTNYVISNIADMRLF